MASADEMEPARPAFRPGSDRELALLVACAGWPPSPARADAVCAAAAADVDWDRFVLLVARHRMAGMAVHGLAAADVTPPAAPDRQLREAARADLIQAMRIAREAARLVALLADEGIAATVLKGPPLAATIYGTLAVRQLRDLDLLVAPEAVVRAMAIMEREGYASRYAGSAAGLRPDRSAVMKDVEFLHPATGILVELHARLSENTELLPMAIVDAAVPVPIAPGLSVPALTGDPLLLYLMVHGFRHGWHRLKWLADVAVIVGTMEASALAAFLGDARARGLGVVVSSTLLVLDEVMRTGLPPAILAEARRGRRARLCAAMAVRHLSDERELDEQAMQVLLVKATRLLASSGPRYLRQEMAQMLVDDGVAIALGGGRVAIALSILLRPVALPARKLGFVARARGAAATRA